LKNLPTDSKACLPSTIEGKYTAEHNNSINCTHDQLFYTLN